MEPEKLLSTIRKEQGIPNQFKRGTDLAGMDVQLPGGQDYQLQGASEGRKPPMTPVLPPRQIDPNTVSEQNPLVKRGVSAPQVDPGMSDEDRMAQIALKQSNKKALSDDEKVFVFKKQREAQAQQQAQMQAQNQAEIQKGVKETGDPEFGRYATDAENAANGFPTRGGLPVNISAAEYLQLTPEQQQAYQTLAFKDQAQKQQDMMSQQADQQRTLLREREAKAQAELDKQRGVFTDENTGMLSEFEAAQRAQADRAKSSVEEAGKEGMTNLQNLSSRRGFGRSSATAQALQKATAATQDQVRQIEESTGAAISDYKIKLLDRMNSKLEKLENRVLQTQDIQDQFEVDNLKAQNAFVMELFKQDPSNPQKIVETADKLAKTRLEQSKELRESSQQLFDNAIKYGFMPESLSAEAQENLANNLGISVKQLPAIIEAAQKKEANKNVDVSYQTDIDGNVTAVVFDKNTGKFTTSDLGGISKGQQSRYQAVTNPITGQISIFDPIKGTFTNGASGGTPGMNLQMEPGTPGKVVISANTGNTPKNLRENCVFFARSIVPDLPVGLITSDQKRKMINTTIPTAGAVAMMPKFGDPKIGHVAVVESVNQDGTVTIVESNVRSGPNGKEISRRTGTPQQLGIEGYWAGKGAKAVNYTTPKISKGESVNADQVYPEAPGQMPFERILMKGGNIDAKEARIQYFSENPQGTMEDFNQRYNSAIEAGLNAKQTGFQDFNQKFNAEQKLSDDLNTQSKDFVKVRDAYNTIQQIGKSPSAAGDLALIYAFMKSLDPGSTVREGEFANAQNAGGVDQKIAAYYNQLAKGERLTPEQRQDFLAVSQNVYNTNLQQQQQLENQFRATAESYNLDPNRVVRSSSSFIQEAPAATFSDQIKEAINSGYSTGEILQTLEKNPDYTEKIQTALSYGYTPDSIIAFLTQQNG